MFAILKRDMRTLVAAVAVSLITAAVTALVLSPERPASAHGVNHARFAHNAAKLSGSGPESFVKSKSVMWAAVGQNGGLVRDKGVAEAIDLSGAGRYHVRFNRRVDKCAWQGTVAANNGTNFGFIEIEESDPSPRKLFIGTQDITGAPANKPFHLLVTC